MRLTGRERILLTCPYGAGSTLKLRPRVEAGHENIETPNQAREREGKGMNRGQEGEGRTEAFDREREEGGTEKSRIVDKDGNGQTNNKDMYRGEREGEGERNGETGGRRQMHVKH